MKNLYFFIALIPCFLNAQWVQVGSDIFGYPDTVFGPVIPVMNAQGTRIAIADGYSDIGATNAGHVRVYDLIANEWVQVGPDIQGDIYPNETFGYSVAINASGEYIAVGINESGVGEGRAGVYEYDGSTWILKGSYFYGENTADDFGRAVALSADGQILAISATGDDANNNSSSGQIRIYQFQSGNWIQVGQDINGLENNDELGNALSLSNNGQILAIAAYRAETANGFYTGKVLIYENQNGIWIKLGSDILGENNMDALGASIDLNADGTRLVIGITGTDVVGNDIKGSVRVYEFDGTNWNILGQELFGKIRLNGFGRAVGINDTGDAIIVGAPTSDPNNPYEGEAWFYRFESGQWLQYGSSLIGDEFGDGLGVDVCISSSGDLIGVASFGSEIILEDHVGKVSVYNTESLLLDMESLDNPNNFISLYPNPANKYLFLKSSSELITEIFIYSQQGRTLQHIHWENGKENITLDIKHLATGSYFIKIITNKNSLVKQIVKY